MLKYLLLRNNGDYDPIHPLTAIHDDLPPPVQERLESTYQDILSGGMFDLVALIRQPISKQPPLENRPISSLREVFVYFVRRQNMSETVRVGSRGAEVLASLPQRHHRVRYIHETRDGEY